MASGLIMQGVELDDVTGPALSNFFKEQMAEQKNLFADFSKVDNINKDCHLRLPKKR